MPRTASLYPGYSPADLAASPLAAYFKPHLAPLAPPVQQALLAGPVAPAVMPPRTEVAALLAPGYQAIETGYTVHPDGSGQVHVLTPMPGVAPEMWAWWFAWHGHDPLRYKLWHPQAHLHVAWADGGGDTGRYVGRTSRVIEYVGAQRLHLTISFVPPRTLGIDEARLAAQGEVAICARAGFDHTPLDTGWVVHHVRPTAQGCEMRSRFWAGGRHVHLRGLTLGRIGEAVTQRMARLVQPIRPQQAADLLVHCAQEMAHLATILPALHERFGATGTPQPAASAQLRQGLG